MRTQGFVRFVIGIALVCNFISCSTWRKFDNTEKGGVVGGGSGALIGAAVGGPFGMVIGGAAGAFGGVVVGDEIK